MTRKTLHGGCVCGEVRYELTSPPLFVHCCHCRDCQIAAGGVFVANAMIEADRLVVTKGAPAPARVPSSTSAVHLVFRCPSCQSPLWSRYGEKALIRYVRVVSLDDQDAAPARAHIFVRSKPPWLTLGDDIPAYETWYKREDVWPAASLARLAAATTTREDV